MNPLWLLRMKRWIQHPASAARVRLVLIVLALCAALFLYERIFGWPETLSPVRARPPVLPP